MDIFKFVSVVLKDGNNDILMWMFCLVLMFVIILYWGFRDVDEGMLNRVGWGLKVDNLF